MSAFSLRRLALSFLLFSLLVYPLAAQPLNPISRRIRGFTAPPATCIFNAFVTDFGFDTTAGKLYVCSALNTWSLVGPGSAPGYPLLAPNGSAAAPSYSFTNFPSTGIYAAAGPSLLFSQNGTQALSITGTQLATFANPFAITGTGGAGQVLRQSSLSGAVTVATLASTDLSDTATVARSTNNLSFFSATSSAQLRTLLNDESGTGLAYFQGGDIGTPSAGVLTNATGLPINSGVSGLASGIATFLGAATSANLRGALSDENGSGSAVFGSPTADVDFRIAQTITNTGSAWLKLLDTTGTNGSYYGLSVNTAFISVNRNPIGGIFVDTAKAGAQINLAGTASDSNITFYTSSTNNTSPTEGFKIDKSQNLVVAPQALTAGTMTVTNSANLRTTTHRFDWTNAMVTALGATTTGDVSVCVLPAKEVVRNMYVVIDTPDTSANALTVAVGRVSATYIDYIVASDAKAAANTVYGDASAERGTNLTGYDLPSITGTTTINAHFIKTTTNLNTVTGSTGHIYITTEVLP